MKYFSMHQNLCFKQTDYVLVRLVKTKSIRKKILKVFVRHADLICAKNGGALLAVEESI